MNNSQKLAIIESDRVPKANAKIEVIGTSVKISHSCGCVLVEHFAPGDPSFVKRENEPEKYILVTNERKYWIELCKEHR